MIRFFTFCRKPASAGFLFLGFSVLLAQAAFSQDYEREQRLNEQTLESLVEGEPHWLSQKNGHRFLGLLIEAENPKGAVIVAHGRGWSPNVGMYGQLRMRLAEKGYTTLALQMPVLGAQAKLIDYLEVYPDAADRFRAAEAFLKARKHKKIAIVSHSLGASMANHYLAGAERHDVKAWVFISIINGLEQMFRIRIPVLDVYGEADWDITRWGADERLKQIVLAPGSEQKVVPNAGHFFEGQEEALTVVITSFLDRVLR
jgi:pimeloyl-ACP methyl ester carboxylesterase